MAVSDSLHHSAVNASLGLKDPTIGCQASLNDCTTECMQHVPVGVHRTCGHTPDIADSELSAKNYYTCKQQKGGKICTSRRYQGSYLSKNVPPEHSLIEVPPLSSHWVNDCWYQPMCRLTARGVGHFKHTDRWSRAGKCQIFK